MKRIAIFCDGTWNRHDAPTPTHVVRLAQALAPEGADGVTQVVHYLPGVGSGEGVTKLSRFLDKFMGGAFGWGLDSRIQEAYRHLVFAYNPGDEIYIFGFSRGAYTARSLAGLIRSAGIPPKDHTERIPEAMDHYRKKAPADTKRVRGPKDKAAREAEKAARAAKAQSEADAMGLPSPLKPYPHPDSEAEIKFRARLSPGTPTSKLDAAWRARNGMGQQDLLKIKYIGVWDTVGALGLPGVLGALAKITNRRYAFHDDKLSSSVSAARHAVAIDERRRLYPPTLWDNLARLNAGSDPEKPPYQQLWFPGNHRIVGGGGTVPELSAFPTAFVLEGAEDAGLAFNPDMRAALLDCADAAADDQGARAKPAFGNLFGLLLADRTLFQGAEEDAPNPAQISRAARLRAKAGRWRPKTLEAVWDSLVNRLGG